MTTQVQSCFKRYEKKYLITPEQQQKIMDGCKRYMKPDEHEKYTIGNIYYDTEDFSLIRDSLEKPIYKEKLRVRSYGTPHDGDTVFAEIKKKYDGIVYKRRITLPAQEVSDSLNGHGADAYGQIGREIAWFQQLHRTQPRVFIGYDRLAFAGIEQSELRMTFDTGLRWRGTALDLREGTWGEAILPPQQVLMEIKIPGAAPLWLSALLSEVGAFPTGFSKYGYCYQNFIVPKRYERKEMRYIA